MKFFNEINSRKLLILVLIVVAIVPLLTLATISFQLAKDELGVQYERQLKSIRDNKKNQIVRLVEDKVNIAQLIAKSKKLAYNLDEHRRVGFESTYYFKKRHLSKINNTALKSEVGKVFKGGRFKILDISSKNYLKNETGILILVLSEDKSEVIGFKVSIEELDEILGEGEKLGFKYSETYVVGRDFKMRSDSFLDPTNRSVVASLKGTVEKNGIRTLATRKALAGITGSEKTITYSKRPVISAYAPLKVFNISWAIVSEASISEVTRRADKVLTNNYLIIVIVSVYMLIVAAFIVAKFLNNRVQTVTQMIRMMMQSVIDGSYSSHFDERNVHVDFRDLVTQINNLSNVFSDNINEIKQLEKAFSQTQRLEAIGTLSSGIAHDFNNILTYLFTYTDLLYIEKDEEKRNNYLAEIEIGIERAKSLVAQIMSFSKQLGDNTETVRFDIVIKEILKLIRASVPKKIEIHNHIEKDVFVRANSTHLHQVAMNIITNAIHALEKDGGIIRVSITKEDNQCLLIISDNGPGMKREVKEKIFDPFFTTKGPQKGSGMGLSVVHGIVTNYGGTIDVVSELNYGAQFKIRFPLSTEYIPRAKTETETVVYDIPEKIVLVDDDVKISESLKLILEHNGAEVTIYNDPEDFLMLHRVIEFDLLITDYNMPKMNGVQICKEALRFRPFLQVLLMSGNEEMIDKTEIGDLDITFIAKPFSKDDMLKAIEIKKAPDSDI